MFTNKFDLVVSMGEDCACAMYLRKSSLRDASYPFDWLCHATFERRIECLKNHFDGFLEKENMRRLDKRRIGCRLCVRLFVRLLFAISTNKRRCGLQFGTAKKS